MPIDALMRFSNQQSVTADANSTDVLDLRAAREFSNGARPLYLVVQVDGEAMADTGSNSTCTVTTETSTDNSSFTAAVQTIGAFAATSAIGTRIIAQLAPSLYNKRYLRLKYTMANGDLSAGKFTAYLTADPDLWTTFAAGYTGPTTA